MKAYVHLLLILSALVFMRCKEANTAEEGDSPGANSIPPREATDPVPAPPHLPDTATEGYSTAPTGTAASELYRITGTEPFWSLTIGQPYSVYRSMGGDSLTFAYKAPSAAAGRPAELVQLFQLADKGWVLLRKGNSPCSDGMSDRDYPYTATLWLNGKLMDGCGQKAEND